MTHAEIDRINLAANRVAAFMIENDPERAGLQKALDNIRRWRRNGNNSGLYRQWENMILSEDWPLIRRAMVKEGADEQRLQQNSPFFNVVPADAWEKIKKKYSGTPDPYDQP